MWEKIKNLTVKFSDQIQIITNHEEYYCQFCLYREASISTKRWSMSMSLKKTSITTVAAARCVAMGSASVSAQESCGSLYNQVMRSYQTQGPQSQHYAAISNFSGERCLSE